MAYKSCFIPIKDESIAHMTIVLWVYFVTKGTIRQYFNMQLVKIEIWDNSELLVCYCSFEIGQLQS